MASDKRQELDILVSELTNERSSFFTLWRDLGDYILPRRTRFYVSDVNKGDRRNLKIIDSTASMALRTLRSGMMAGVTSPARPWFRLTTPDPKLEELDSVKEWLYEVTGRMQTVFIRSNLYNILPIVYGDMATFGTACMYVEPDPENVIHCYIFPLGEFMISANEKYEIDVFAREFQLTVRQIVSEFGKDSPADEKIHWERLSSSVKTAWDSGNKEQWINVVHVIRPNPLWDPSKRLSKYKKYESTYYEKSMSTTDRASDTLLYEGGLDYFPILAPRWEVTAGDVYGTECPGILVLGDVKALQTMHKRKAQALEKMVNPPLQAPASLETKRVSSLPGEITYVDILHGQQGMRPVHEVNLRLQELMMDISEHQQRIRKGFFEDLFLMLAMTDRRQITAREIDERHEEKLLALGPVLEQLNQDLLDPLIDVTFAIMLEKELIPPPPEELQGMALKVEYISIMAQAQKIIGIGGIERFTGFSSQMAQINPTILDKVNADQIIDVYADLTSIPPGIVRSDEDVDKMRKQRAAVAQQQQMAQMMKDTVTGAKELSQSDLSKDNALSRLVG